VSTLSMCGGAEEDRTRQRDGDHGVGAIGEHLVPDQLGKARFTGTIRLARGDDLARDATGEFVSLCQQSARPTSPLRTLDDISRILGRMTMPTVVRGGSVTVGREACRWLLPCRGLVAGWRWALVARVTSL